MELLKVLIIKQRLFLIGPMDFVLLKLTNWLFIIVWGSYQDLNPVSNSCEEPVLLRTEALCNTELKRAQAVTLRIKILKVAAIVKVSTRRILIRLPSAYPYWGIWTKAYASGF